MREIKFRAQITNKNNLSSKWVYFGIMKPKLASWEEYTTPDLQYSGAKDANGVEIYEGDIIRRQTLAKSGVRYVNKSRAHHRVVEYKQSHVGLGFNIGNPSSWEVIGNIYEDKDLAKWLKTD